jgi:hypothetical protein
VLIANITTNHLERWLNANYIGRTMSAELLENVGIHTEVVLTAELVTLIVIALKNVQI